MKWKGYTKALIQGRKQHAGKLILNFVTHLSVNIFLSANMLVRRRTNAHNQHIVENRPTKRAEIVAPHVVIRAVEHYPGTICRGTEWQDCFLRSTSPFRLIRHLGRLCTCAKKIFTIIEVLFTVSLFYLSLFLLYKQFF